jgi:hypothetical protein
MTRFVSKLWTVLILCVVAGCGSTDPRIEQIRADREANDPTPSDETIKHIIAETEAKYGDATEDEYGYPLYSG